MNEANLCPVPVNQIPLQEFQKLSDSWFFSWPLNKAPNIYRRLILSWILIMPLNILVASGSYTLHNNIPKLIAVSCIVSLFLPMLLLARQFMGWSYILKRLISENVEYEKTGWYDGDIWEKPISWRQRDLLIAHYEVRPAINNLSRSIVITSFMIFLVLTIYNLVLN